jgi:hypothetical protein
MFWVDDGAEGKSEHAVRRAVMTLLSLFIYIFKDPTKPKIASNITRAREEAGVLLV